MGKFVVSDSNSSSSSVERKAPGYGDERLDEAQSSHRSVNNNEILSGDNSSSSEESSSSGLIGGEGTVAPEG